MRESTIEAHLVKSVTEKGGLIRKVQWIGRRGAPDRCVMMNGKTVWIELKAPGKKPQPHQEREHERMRQMGQTVLVVDSIEGVDALLGNLWDL